MPTLYAMAEAKNTSEAIRLSLLLYPKTLGVQYITLYNLKFVHILFPEARLLPMLVDAKGVYEGFGAIRDRVGKPVLLPLDIIGTADWSVI